MLFFARAFIDLYYLGIINPRSKAGMNCIEIRPEPVGGDLEVSRGSPFQLFREGHCVSGGAPSEMPSQNQFCAPLDCNEAVSISERRVTAHIALFFAPDEHPNLIALNIGQGNTLNFGFQQPLASISREYQNLHDRVLVDASESLNRTDRATLDQKVDNTFHFLRGRVHSAQVLVTRIGVCLVALAATIALLAFAGLSKFSAFGLAIMAGHGACLSAEASP